MPFSIFPGDQDWQNKFSWNGIFGPTQPMQPPVIPTATPPTGSFADKLVGKLNSPAAQLGLRILANNRGGQSLGNVLGTSALQYQQGQAEQTQADMQRQLMQAQIAHLQRPENQAGSPIGVVPPERYTPASIAKFLQTKNYGDLEPVQSQINQGGVLGAYDKHVQQAKASGQEPLGIMEFLKSYTDATTKMSPSVTTVANIPTVVTPQRGGGASQTPLTTLPTVASNASTVAGAESGGRTTATQRAEAALDLPRVVANAKQGVKAIDDLMAAEGAPRIFGAQGMLPVIPGTKRADAKAYLEQIQGKTFLEAYNTLKGGGQITEVEGAKAQAAIARLNRAQSWEAAQRSLGELKEVINAGVARAEQKAGGAPVGNRIRVDAQGNVVK